MVVTFKLMHKVWKCKKKGLNVKYHITLKSKTKQNQNETKKNPYLSPTTYHVLQLNFLSSITVLYYKPLLVLWYTLKKNATTKTFLFSLFSPIMYLSYR